MEKVHITKPKITGQQSFKNVSTRKPLLRLRHHIQYENVSIGPSRQPSVLRRVWFQRFIGLKGIEPIDGARRIGIISQQLLDRKSVV